MAEVEKGRDVQGGFFRVDGADLETGEETYVVLQAVSAKEAEAVARKQGLLIASVRAATAADWGAAPGVKVPTSTRPVKKIVFESARPAAATVAPPLAARDVAKVSPSRAVPASAVSPFKAEARSKDAPPARPRPPVASERTPARVTAKPAASASPSLFEFATARDPAPSRAKTDAPRTVRLTPPVIIKPPVISARANVDVHAIDAPSTTVDSPPKTEPAVTAPVNLVVSSAICIDTIDSKDVPQSSAILLPVFDPPVAADFAVSSHVIDQAVPATHSVLAGADAVNGGIHVEVESVEVESASRTFMSTDEISVRSEASADSQVDDRPLSFTSDVVSSQVDAGETATVPASTPSPILEAIHNLSAAPNVIDLESAPIGVPDVAPPASHVGPATPFADSPMPCDIADWITSTPLEPALADVKFEAPAPGAEQEFEVMDDIASLASDRPSAMPASPAPVIVPSAASASENVADAGTASAEMQAAASPVSDLPPPPAPGVEAPVIAASADSSPEEVADAGTASVQMQAAASAVSDLAAPPAPVVETPVIATSADSRPEDVADAGTASVQMQAAASAASDIPPPLAPVVEAPVIATSADSTPDSRPEEVAEVAAPASIEMRVPEQPKVIVVTAKPVLVPKSGTQISPKRVVPAPPANSGSPPRAPGVVRAVPDRKKPWSKPAIVPPRPSGFIPPTVRGGGAGPKSGFARRPVGSPPGAKPATRLGSIVPPRRIPPPPVAPEESQDHEIPPVPEISLVAEVIEKLVAAPEQVSTPAMTPLVMEATPAVAESQQQLVEAVATARIEKPIAEQTPTEVAQATGDSISDELSTAAPAPASPTTAEPAFTVEPAFAEEAAAPREPMAEIASSVIDFPQDSAMKEIVEASQSTAMVESPPLASIPIAYASPTVAAARPFSLVLCSLCSLATLATLAGAAIALVGLMRTPSVDLSDVEKLDFHIQTLTRAFLGGMLFVAGLLMFFAAGLAHVAGTVKSRDMR